ncbi:RES family NAD+ phosphorylase [Psychrobacillus sp. MER TA 171]|nr:RES family NAD+ phosphorylase [Psychrobacillus sp. MER TA 171]
MLQDDWLIFPDGTGESLLYDIMNENKDDELGETIDETTFFSTVEKTFTYRDGSDLWNTFKKRLIKENRFFPNQELDTFTSLNELYGLLEDIMINLKVSISEDSSIYRSRIGHFTEIIDLQAPPFEKVLKGGRANPVGISVLYCAETPETAISEVRPWKGAEVTVATIYPTKDLVLVDLSSVEKLESPFITSNLREVLTSRKLLLNLQEMLSKPVNPNTSEIEYIPSQFLTEFIKSLGYDGIVFKSSLGLNNNLVIFDEGNTVIKGLSYYNLTDIRINYTQI